MPARAPGAAIKPVFVTVEERSGAIVRGERSWQTMHNEFATNCCVWHSTMCAAQTIEVR
jgi:hypothetical protein